MTGSLIGLERAGDDSERARILLQAPLWLLIRELIRFEAACGGFAAGSAYVEELRRAARLPRHRGAFGTMPLDGATTRLIGIAEGWVPR